MTGSEIYKILWAAISKMQCWYWKQVGAYVFCVNRLLYIFQFKICLILVLFCYESLDRFTLRVSAYCFYSNKIPFCFKWKTMKKWKTILIININIAIHTDITLYQYLKREARKLMMIFVIELVENTQMLFCMVSAEVKNYNFFKIVCWSFAKCFLTVA